MRWVWLLLLACCASVNPTKSYTFGSGRPIGPVFENLLVGGAAHHKIGKVDPQHVTFETVPDAYPGAIDVHYVVALIGPMTNVPGYCNWRTKCVSTLAYRIEVTPVGAQSGREVAYEDLPRPARDGVGELMNDLLTVIFGHVTDRGQ